MCYLSLRPSVYDRKRRAIASVTLSLNITVHKIFGSAADDSAAGSAADGSAADGSAADGSAADDSVAGTVATASAAVRLGLHALRCTLVIAARAPPAPAYRSCACGALRLALLLGHCASTALGCCCLGRRDSLIWCIWPELAKHACSRLGFPRAVIGAVGSRHPRRRS